jgi:hypothetical protein
MKGLAWKSVQIPMMMPKPDLVELTGHHDPPRKRARRELERPLPTPRPDRDASVGVRVPR